MSGEGRGCDCEHENCNEGATDPREEVSVEACHGCSPSDGRNWIWFVSGPGWKRK